MSRKLLWSALGAGIVITAMAVSGMALADTGNSAASALSAQKQAVLNGIMASAQAAAAQPQPPKSHAQPAAEPLGDASMAPGIYSGFGSSPLPAAQFEMSNYWFDMVNGDRVFVYAGAQGSSGDPIQGMVVLWTENPAGRVTLSDINTPSVTGAVSVVAANGLLLNLQSTQGVAYQFDVASSTFA
jgi:hypothetical protein